MKRRELEFLDLLSDDQFVEFFGELEWWKTTRGKEIIKKWEEQDLIEVKRKKYSENLPMVK